MSNGAQETELPTNEILLIEYQKAQDSAEHHDKLVWTVSSIFFAGLTALLGFIVKDYSIIIHEPIILLVSIIALIMIYSLYVFISSLRMFKNVSYKRCRIIERKLGMEQHLRKAKEVGKQTRMMWILLASYFIMFILIILNHFYSVCSSN